MEKESLFSFLKTLHPKLAELSTLLEDDFFNDYRTSLIRARQISEQVIEDYIYKQQLDIVGTNLYEKTNELYRSSEIAREEYEAFEQVRLLGNKAVHDATTYTPTLSEALKVYKYIYKILKWYAEIVDYKVKVPPYRDPEPSNHSLDEDFLKNQISSMLSSQLEAFLKEHAAASESSNQAVQTEIPTPSHETAVTLADEEQEDLGSTHSVNFIDELATDQSKLIQLIQRLKTSSKEAIESPSRMTDFKKYLHTNRDIENYFEEALKEAAASPKAEMILLCGNVGDGKSHMLSYFNEMHPDLMAQFTIINDATESYDPSLNSIDNLNNILSNFKDANIKHSKQKIILAINLGVLHNFVYENKQISEYSIFQKSILDHKVFLEPHLTKVFDEHFRFILLTNFKPFHFTSNGVESKFFGDIFNKIFNKSEHNPFFQAINRDFEDAVNTIVHENFLFLSDRQVQDKIIQLLIKAILETKIVVSVRSLLNFIADILLPDELNVAQEYTDLEKLKFTTPSLLFDSTDTSNILRSITLSDPVIGKSKIKDELLFSVKYKTDYNSHLDTILNYKLLDDNWLKFYSKQDDISKEFTEKIGNFGIRFLFLIEDSFFQEALPLTYQNFIKALSAFETNKRSVMQIYHKEIIDAFYKWNGSHKKGYVYISSLEDKYRIAKSIELEPYPKDNGILFNTLRLNFVEKHNKSEVITLEIDYSLFNLLSLVNSGYYPSKNDEEKAIRFLEFVENVKKLSDPESSILIDSLQENLTFTLNSDAYGGFIVRKEGV